MDLLFVLCCLVVPSPSPARVEAPSLTAPTVVYALSAVADNGSTYLLLSIGGFERNPIIKSIDDKPGLVLAIGTAADVATAIGLRKLGKHRPTLAKWALYGIAAVKLLLAADNFRAYSQWRRRQ